MTGTRRIGAVAALSGMTAVAAMLSGLPSAKADELTDLRANQDLLQQRLEQLAQVSAAGSKAVPGTGLVGGSFPRSFIIPGTDTSLRVGGEVRLSVDYFLSGGGNQVNALQTNTIGTNGVAERTPLDRGGKIVPGIGAVPVDLARSRSHFVTFSPRESRLHIETRTPTAWGQASTVFEFDFNGGAFSSDPPQTANSLVPRLRHAYATIGGLLVGQTYPFLYDTSAFPDVLDFGGDVDIGPSRQPLIRYTGHLPTLPFGLPRGQFAVELMQPNTDVVTRQGKFDAGTTTAFPAGFGTLNPSGGTINPAKNPAPDLMLGLEFNEPAFHMRLGGIVRDLQFQDGRFFDKEFLGYGGGWTGWVKPGWFGWQRDQFTWLAVAGTGIGHWISGLDASGLDTNYGAAPITTAAAAGNVIVKPVDGFGARISYQHYWLPTLRSNVDVGVRHMDYDSNLIGPTQNITINKELVTAHANLIWAPVPFADVGVEYVYGHRQVVANLKGDVNAILSRFRMRF